MNEEEVRAIVRQELEIHSSAMAHLVEELFNDIDLNAVRKLLEEGQ
jgi:hypothetical protein